MIEDMKETSNKILNKDSITATNELMIIKSNKPIDTISEISANYDLLVLGTPESDNWRNVLFGGKDKVATNSACSVLRLTMKH